MRKKGKRSKALFICAAAIVMLVLLASVAAASAGGEHKTEPMERFFYRILNAGLLIFALGWAFKKYGMPALGKRAAGIKEDLEDLEARKAAAAKELEDINKRLASLEAEAENVVDEYRRQGEAAKARIIEEAGHAAERLSEQAKRSMEHEFAQAKQRLQEEILDQAVAVGEEMIKKNITDQDQDRLVGEYLDKVVQS